jgi:hypothetical protein
MASDHFMRPVLHTNPVLRTDMDLTKYLAFKRHSEGRYGPSHALAFELIEDNNRSSESGTLLRRGLCESIVVRIRDSPRWF